MIAMSLDELRALLARHARPDLSTDIEAVRIFRADRPSPPVPTTYGQVLALVAQGTNGSRWATACTSTTPASTSSPRLSCR